MDAPSTDRAAAPPWARAGSTPGARAQGRYLVGADGAIEGGDASDDLVRDLQTLGREKLADAVRDTAR